MKLIDTHIHLTDSKYQGNNLSQILNEESADIKRVITLGTDLKDSISAKNVSMANGKVFFCAGVHPHDADKFDESQLVQFRELFAHKKCVAVGEIGLDFHYEYSSKDKQIEVFKLFLEMAREYNLPVSVHSRAAEQEVYQILKNYQDLKIVCHSYTGNPTILELFRSLDIYFSINGMITFNKNQNIVDIVKKIPLNRLILETDGPYLAPIPHRGKLNHPAYVSIVVSKLAEVLNKSVDSLAEITTQNAEEVFFSDM